MPVKLGDLLLKENMITPQQLQEALAHQRLKGGRLSGALVSLGYVRDDEIGSLLSRRYGVPSIDLHAFEVDPRVLRIIPAPTARKYQILPLSVAGATLTLAVADPTNVFAVDDIKFMTGYNVECVVASESALEEGIERYYAAQPSRTLREADHPEGGSDRMKEVLGTPGVTPEELASVALPEVDLDALARHEADGPASDREEIDLGSLGRPYHENLVAKLAGLLIVEALKRGASDIHVEPYAREFRVRFRIDGHLHNVMALPQGLREPLTSRFKALARLDVRDRRQPQHGRTAVRLRLEDLSRDVDLRISCLPSRWGETIVLRLLDPSTLVRDLTRLGFERGPLARLQGALDDLRGLVVVAGPVGSGRTTTLYSALAALTRPGASIVTLEESAAFSVPGIDQIALRPDLGYDFRTALGSGLDQAPDVVAVDCIGDETTMEATVRVGARSGRLVLAAMLEADAPSALTTLVERTGQASIVARAVRVVVAQRLVRRICASCRIGVANPTSPPGLDCEGSHEQGGAFKAYEGKGCRSCSLTGYRGRVGLFEVLVVSEGIRDLVRVGAVASEIRRMAVEEGMLSLRMSGIEKIKAGDTTIAEVLRHTER